VSSDPPAIDDLDRRIVERLRVDGREPNSSLAKALKVNQATIASRLRRLDATRAMRVVTVTDIAGFGFAYFALAFITVADRSSALVGRDIAQIPDVVTVAGTTGRYDLIAIALVRTARELGLLIGDRLLGIKGVDRVRCELAAEILRFDTGWAAFRTPGEQLNLPGPELSASDAVDDLDLQIIHELQRDARISHRSVAAALGVSESTVRGRTRRLETDGLVRIRAVSDVEAFGLNAMAIVGVRARGGHSDLLGTRLGAIDGVRAVVKTVGEYDFVLFVVTTDRAEIVRALGSVHAVKHVRGTETFDVLATHKHLYTWVRLID
jgi:Lrp/AsnC family transcriptional regulator for asnA, asnC and gidA